ncbi:PspA/IM30 family protein [Actinomycetaceae bacterium TAE3-ERU4]|nr:PspA/IM30 family protein [Actinomycetaceae bacterium TAE3-ERU4]
MTEKQSILGRITQLAKANINALLDRAEDPQKMLDQMIRDYTNSIAEAESAVAQTIGNLRLSEKDHAADLESARDWGTKALAASNKADELRQKGDLEAANKFDQLAKVALGKQIDAEREAKNAEPMIATQRDVVEKLKAGVSSMRNKLEDLKNKRDELVARSKTAAAQNMVQDAVSKISVLDPTSELSRFEDRVRREEAMAAGRAEIALDSIESQFSELDAMGDHAEIEARLAALKNNS